MCNSCEDKKRVIGVPESEWTKGQSEFVGTQFPTPKGGVLTVVGVIGNNKGGAVFSLECSICSKDVELWPVSSIKSVKGDLVRGKVPCGCAKITYWTEDQYKVKIKRKCNEIGYIFHGWYGEYNNKRTYLDLENLKTGNRWQTTTIESLLRGTGDPFSKRGIISLSKTKNYDEHLKDFHKAGFTKDYVFWRSERKDSQGYLTFWNYTCPICSKDEYVGAGVCNGIFEGYISDIKKGKKSCRCSSRYRWTQEQREYQINKICKEDGLTFIGWEGAGVYSYSSSKFTWFCTKKHRCITRVDNFLSGNRCLFCYESEIKEQGFCNGYYPHRVDEKDFLYIIDFNGKYIKVGRTFDIENRLNKRKTGLIDCSKVPRESVKILRVFTSNHQTIYDTEQWLHEELRERGFEYNEEDGQWSIELFDIDSLPVLDYLMKDTELEDVSDEYKD